MPRVRFSIHLYGTLNMSQAESRPAAMAVRIAGAVRDAAPANADIAFGFLLLFTWQLTAIAVRPKYLVPVAALTLALLLCAHFALGRSVWLRRVGWVAPRRGFCFYSVGSGVAAAVVVWAIALFFHQSLGAVPPPYKVLLASSSGALLEELLFRGFLFWLLFQFLTRVRILHRCASATAVLVIAFAFALSHTAHVGVGLFTTMLTGTAYGWIRVQSGSTAAAAVMHGIYNLAISCIATF